MKTRTLLLAGALYACSLGSSGCAFGEVADSTEEFAATVSFLTSLLPADRGAGRVPLRFGDGGTDAFDTFTTSNTIVLSGANWVEFERIEIVTGSATAVATREPGAFLERVAARTLDLLRPPGLDHTNLFAHGGTDSSDSGGDTVIVGEDLFYRPLAAGSSGNGKDSLDRFYYEINDTFALFGSGSIERVVFHFRRFQFSGTVDGTAFAVLHDTPSDYQVTLACYREIVRDDTLDVPVFFNIAVLFRSLPSADAAGVASAFASNVSSSDLIQEHECF